MKHRPSKSARSSHQARRYPRISILMWGVLLTPLLIAVFAACAGQSTPEWTENEAKAHLAQQLFDDANIRYDQKIADRRRATIPSRLETSVLTLKSAIQLLASRVLLLEEDCNAKRTTGI